MDGKLHSIALLNSDLQRRSHRATRQIFIGFFIYDSSFSTETFRINIICPNCVYYKGIFFQQQNVVSNEASS